ncbi:hypothetical protein FCM35_KLT05348 [Carex littledalei]|uniref:DUF7642 domain-containing protein n=1 Tax=Carex littledalei TaxID=544730 RepID=A0A833QZU7_9POAL|nr:hypothetical protein FCM35_KLT05348 [Carex littledalei]
MGSNDDAIQIPIDALERHLLSGSPSFSKKEKDEDEEDASMVLYTASFEEMEERFIKYQTAKWVLYSLVLILAWGIGLLMLLYLPVRIYIARKEFRSKKLYLTPDAIIYKVCRPLSIPCFGDLKKEKYIILPSVADVILEQGYIQSYFGLYSIRIEYKGVRRPASDDVNIQGVAVPSDFQKAVLTQLSSIRSEQLGKQASTSLEVPSGDLILQKLDEVEGSLKRVHALIETSAQISNS